MAQRYGNGFAMLAVAVAIIAWNEYRDPRRLLPQWSTGVGAVAGLASFTGWVLAVWLDTGPANLLSLLASGVMCIWIARFGTMIAGTIHFN